MTARNIMPLKGEKRSIYMWMRGQGAAGHEEEAVGVGCAGAPAGSQLPQAPQAVAWAL